MAYTEPNYWAGGPAGDSPTADGLNVYADNLTALVDLLQGNVNWASGTKYRGSHPLFTFAHRCRYLFYVSEGSDATGAIVGLREEEENGEEVRLPYAATVQQFDLDSVEWLFQSRQYVVREVRYAQELD
jgi:hypothetical protein